MEWNYTTILLLTTGLGTASAIFYFFSPGFVLKNFAKLR